MDITWEQFQEAYQQADDAIRAFIDSEKTADIIFTLKTLGLADEHKNEAVKIIGYLKLGLISDSDLPTLIAAFSSNPQQQENILTTIRAGVAGEELPELTATPTEPVAEKESVRSAIPQASGVNELTLKQDKAQATGKDISLNQKQEENKAAMAEHRSQGIRTMKDDVNRIQAAPASDFTKSFKGS